MDWRPSSIIRRPHHTRSAADHRARTTPPPPYNGGTTQVRGGGAVAAGLAPLHLPFDHWQRRARGGIGLRCGGGGGAWGVHAPAAQEGGAMFGWQSRVECWLTQHNVINNTTITPTAHRRRGAALALGVHPREHRHDLHPGTQRVCIQILGDRIQIIYPSHPSSHTHIPPYPHSNRSSTRSGASSCARSTGSSTCPPPSARATRSPTGGGRYAACVDGWLVLIRHTSARTRLDNHPWTLSNIK